MTAFLHENANKMVYNEEFFKSYLFSTPFLLNFRAIYSLTLFKVRRQGRPWTLWTPLVQRPWLGMVGQW